ncbi:MAG: hypothetical protein Q4B84_00320 [Clostridia bacterium]|nr:hypothetical protein [Clostridia bacterium]
MSKNNNSNNKRTIEKLESEKIENVCGGKNSGVPANNLIVAYGIMPKHMIIKYAAPPKPIKPNIVITRPQINPDPKKIEKDVQNSINPDNKKEKGE